MKSGNKASVTKWEWRKFSLQIIAIVISVAAIIITMIMNGIQQRNNQNQFGTVEARLGKLDQPNLSAKIKVAFSPNYSAALDQQYLDQVGMKRKNVGYDFYNQSLEEYLDPNRQDQTRYLFFQFMNEGPGIAGHLRIDKVIWKPKNGSTPPAGLEQVTGIDYGIINPGQMLTFLVDASPIIGTANLQASSNAADICVEFSYTSYINDTQWIKGNPLCLSTAGPAQIEPMRPAENS